MTPAELDAEARYADLALSLVGMDRREDDADYAQDEAHMDAAKCVCVGRQVGHRFILIYEAQIDGIRCLECLGPVEQWQRFTSEHLHGNYIHKYAVCERCRPIVTVSKTNLGASEEPRGKGCIGRGGVLRTPIGKGAVPNPNTAGSQSVPSKPFNTRPQHGDDLEATRFGNYILNHLVRRIMDFAELDITPMKEPMKGIELKRFFANFPDLRQTQNALLRKRALVCLSPNRKERCDSPAMGIFWQDQAEWYPCCDAHWPGQTQWTGSTKFHGGYITLNCFDERLDYEEINIHPLGQGGDKVERYNRADAV